MTPLHDARILIEHHIEDFWKYIESGYILCANLSLEDIEEILVEFEGTLAGDQLAKEFRARIREARSYMGG